MINFADLLSTTGRVTQPISNQLFHSTMNPNDQRSTLFSEFPPISTAQWEEKILADLKGGDYTKKLIWKTDEGFDVKPYYREEDLDGLEHLEALPAESPFTRGNRKEGNDWIIRQDFITEEIEEANAQACEAVLRGADAVGLRARHVAAHTHMNRLLQGIDPEKTEIHFTASKSYPLTLELFVYEINHRGLDGKKISGSLNFDAIGYLLLHGNFYKTIENNLDEAEYLIGIGRKHLPCFRFITVNGQFFRDAGSTIVEELAFSLASGNEYLAGLTSKGVSVDEVASALQFSFGTGSDYFLEIAKLRAARYLWARIVEQYKPVHSGSGKMYIHSTTTSWNKTLYDPYVNMLRTTTEGMAAAIGNSDSVSVQAFDQVFRQPGEFSSRIARNQQLILKEEAYLDKVADPSAGSYYIENLTDSIITHAWNLFLEVEANGGLLECIRSGFIQDHVEASAQKKEAALAQRKTVLIGTNQYPNLSETIVSADLDFSSGESDSTPFRKLMRYRVSEGFERLRLAVDKYAVDSRKRPEVTLLPLGNLAMRKARATFSTNFFGCAGFSVTDHPEFKSPEEAISAVAGKPEIAVICSSDDEYAAFAGQIAKGIRKVSPSTIILVAGYPKEIVDVLKADGVDDFIHVRSNVLETLEKFCTRLGINI